MTKYSEIAFNFITIDKNKKCQSCSSSMLDLGLIDVNIISNYVENDSKLKENFKKIENKDFINSIIKNLKKERK